MVLGPEIMAEQINGYNGAVNGLDIVGGFAVAKRPDSRSNLPSSSAIEKAVEPVIARAIVVIGNREEAMRWLGTPVWALEQATPISMLHNIEGRKEVLAVLDQLEHGVL